MVLPLNRRGLLFGGRTASDGLLWPRVSAELPLLRAGRGGVNDLVSKHFRVVWGPSDEVTMSWGNFTTNGPALARGNLRTMEDQWQVYVKILGYREPCESVEPAKRDGNRYKVNLMVGRTELSRHQGGGYFVGYEGTAGFGCLILRRDRTPVSGRLGQGCRRVLRAPERHVVLREPHRDLGSPRHRRRPELHGELPAPGLRRARAAA